MRISLTEIAELEHYLLKKGNPDGHLVTEARLLTSTEWRENAQDQFKAYQLIKLHGRELLRKEIKEVEGRLFTDRSFRPFQDLIHFIFKRH